MQLTVKRVSKKIHICVVGLFGASSKYMNNCILIPSFNKLLPTSYISCEIDYKYIYVCRKSRKYSLLCYDIYIGNPLECSIFNGNLPWFYTTAKWYYAQQEKTGWHFLIYFHEYTVGANHSIATRQQSSINEIRFWILC